MPQDEAKYLPLIKAFSFTVKQFRLYSEAHPITRQSLLSTDQEINRYFESAEKVTLGAMRHRLLVDGALVGEKEVSAKDLAKDLERLQIDGVILKRGMDINELTSFMKLMAMRPKAIQERGGFEKLVEMADFRHIALSHGRFHLVEEGQTVAEEADVGTGQSGEPPELAEDSESSVQTGSGPEVMVPRKVGSIVDVINRIRAEERDISLTGENLYVEEAKLVEEIEKKPEALVEKTLAEEQDAARLEQMIRKVIKFLLDRLVPFLAKQGKDISRALDRLSREFDKALQKFAGENEYDGLREKIPQIFEEGTDELRIQMMVETYKHHSGDLKEFQKAAGKLFKNKGIRERLLPGLREEMTAAGMDGGCFDGVFQTLEEKEASRKRKTSIDQDELEELRRKAELYDQGQGGDSEKRIQKLEIENKIIRQQKERVDTVIRNLGEGLMVVDDKGDVVLMNPAAERLLGMKQGDKAGKPLLEGLKPEHMVAMTSGPLRDGADGDVSRNVELISLNNETKRILQASTAVVENEDGQTVGMVSVLSDVTQQKELEELKTKFVANVSHELRTPLVATQKSLALILEKELGDISEEQHKFLTIAHRNIERLSRLINDLLDISKLEAQKLNVKPAPFPVKGLVMHVASTVETWARDKKIRLETHLPETEIEIEADADRITQVLTNLVGNAMKYTPDEGTITIEAFDNVQDPEVSSDGCIEIGVRDSGIGISPEDQKKIFDKFVQIEVHQPAGISSTGLGLTIAKEIVQLHSGKIWVESEQGKGSRFALRLPRKFKLNERV